MGYSFSDQHGTPLLVAGATLPREVLTLYRDDSPETKLAMRRLWQSLHVYGRCWSYVEPLDSSCEFYKCRFSSSKKCLFDAQQSFFFLLPQKQVHDILQAPDQPIAWEIMRDQDGIEYPINVFGWDRALWQPGLPEQRDGESLEQHKERVAVDPVDKFQEAIPFETIIQATLELLPDLPDDGYPPKRALPAILLLAAHLMVTQKQHAQAHDIFERQWLQKRAEDLTSMLEWKRVWWWDREHFVELEPIPIGEQMKSGICLVNIGIHPEVREKRWAALGLNRNTRIS